MKKLFLVCFLVPTVALAAVGIKDSSHDLSNGSGTSGDKNTNASSTAADQICIYCHAPHKANTSRYIWNHDESTTATWDWGDDLDSNPVTKTAYGTALPTTLNTPSKLCLSCHDATQALGDVGNIGDGSSGNISDLTGTMTANKQVGASGDMTGAHPVSIPYAGQVDYDGVTSSVPAAKVGASVLGGYYSVTTDSCDSPTTVCTVASGTDIYGSRINLYPDDPASINATANGIECGSCHDVHNQYDLPYFGWVDVTKNSALCLSCHNK